MRHADEQKLLGAWQELASGSASRLELGGVIVDVLKQSQIWQLLVPLKSTAFSSELQASVSQQFPDYHLLLLGEQCFLHRSYPQLTSRMLHDIHAIVARIKEQSW